MLAACAIVFWAIYGFQVGVVPGLPFPVPAAAHAIPILRLLAHSEGGHQAFLLGENSTHGWPAYFPVAFLLKTPLAGLIAMAVGVGGLLTGAVRRRQLSLNGLPAVLFAAVYVVASIASPLNIGYRHLLPLLPLGYLAAGAALGRRSRFLRLGSRSQAFGLLPILAIVCVLGQGSATLSRTPDLIAFFNVAGGGADQGWRYLADSNTDWGQGYKALARFQKAQGTGPVKLAAFIFYDPALYGVRYTPLPPLGGDTPALFPSRFAPQPGAYVISATPLDGIPTADPEMYDWFRWREPDARVAGALFYYDVDAAGSRDGLGSGVYTAHRTP